MSELVSCNECNWTGKKHELFDKITFAEKLNNYITTKNYKERTHLHWMRDCLRNVVLSGAYYPGNIYSDIRDYIKKESELNEIQ